MIGQERDFYSVCHACGARHRGYKPLWCVRCRLKGYLKICYKEDIKKLKLKPLPVDKSGNLMSKRPLGMLQPGTRFSVIGTPGKTGEVKRITESSVLVQYDGERSPIHVAPSCGVEIVGPIKGPNRTSHFLEKKDENDMATTPKKKTTERKPAKRSKANTVTKEKAGSKKNNKETNGKELEPCRCGCGEMANPGRTFRQGHDARFHGRVKRLAMNNSEKKAMTWAELEDLLADKSVLKYYKKAVKDHK